ncbi:MAG: hypothetical protein PWP41_853 [Moorella sp. (in: firmicutes)]|nr:hypothetical protein [Moorella sp. (in: firmicutes)]
MPKKELPEFKGDRIPEFAGEEEEREFWDSHSFAEAMERGELEPVDEPIEVAPELEASLKTKRVTLRLRYTGSKRPRRWPGRRIPFQTLIGSWIAEAVLKGRVYVDKKTLKSVAYYREYRVRKSILLPAVKRVW